MQEKQALSSRGRGRLRGFLELQRPWGLDGITDSMDVSLSELQELVMDRAQGDLTSLAPHERLPEILVVPREKTPTGAAARGNP